MQRQRPNLVSTEPATIKHSGLTPSHSVPAIPTNAGWSQISNLHSLLGLNAFLRLYSMLIAENYGGEANPQ
jgi:hypothetical protein